MNIPLSPVEMRNLFDLLCRADSAGQIELHDAVDAHFYFKGKHIKQGEKSFDPQTLVLDVRWDGNRPMPEEATIAAKRVSQGLTAEPGSWRVEGPTYEKKRAPGLRWIVKVDDKVYPFGRERQAQTFADEKRTALL